ncbi:MAG: FAD-dependent oxidoreductase [Legionellaceae bacterium]|nr:FAD-dependent oxidoreductase [Legionellaceae bacterium]
MVEGRGVLVVGGGIVGLASAIAMASRGFSVTVLDAGVLEAQAVGKNTRVYAINTASQRLLEQLGVWHLLPEIAFSPYQEMHIWDASNQAEMNFSARDVARAELGFILEERLLKQALLKRASAMDITLVSGASVSEAIETPTGFLVHSEDGRAWEAALCMIADGARSTIRDLLKVPVTSWSYHHDALVATVHTEKPHQKIAYQVFSADGPLAFLPLKDPHQCSIVWSHPPEHIKALMALDNVMFEAQLTKAFAEKLGQVKLLSGRIAFPLKMRHVEQYVGASWMLLGDAAHTIHPLAGLGLNVGLADLSAWLRLLDAQKAMTLSARTLSAYQRERKYAVWSVIALMQGIKSFFGISATPASTFRGFGMRALNQLRPLKRILIAYAAGETI